MTGYRTDFKYIPHFSDPLSLTSHLYTILCGSVTHQNEAFHYIWVNWWCLMFLLFLLLDICEVSCCKRNYKKDFDWNDPNVKMCHNPNQMLNVFVCVQLLWFKWYWIFIPGYIRITIKNKWLKGYTVSFTSSLCLLTAGAATDWHLWLLEVCEERDPERGQGGPGRHQLPHLTCSHVHHCI